jgi:hypothetical protein
MNADSERKKPKHAGPQMAVRWLPVEALEPDPRNARLHPPGQVSRIADSIAAFGFNVPVLIDGESRIVAGHGRALAARRLGLAEIPTIALDHLSEAERRAFMIADNRLAELASWDENRLGVELEALKCLDLDFALSATGFEIGEIDLKIEPPHGPGRGRGPRRRRGPPVARAGETWALGPHRLVCGDAHDEVTAPSTPRSGDGRRRPAKPRAFTRRESGSTRSRAPAGAPAPRKRSRGRLHEDSTDPGAPTSPGELKHIFVESSRPLCR